MNDLDGTFLYVNRKCEEISGYQREEVIGKNFLEVNLIPENSLTMASELFQDTINGESTSSAELELIRKDGRRVPIEIRANVVRYKGQAVMLSFVRDTSERKRVESALQESEQSYRRLAAYHKQLNDISISFIEADDKQNLFDRITESFRLLTGAMGATFSLYDQQTRDLKVVSVSIDPVYRHKVDFLLGPDLFDMRMPISADVMEEMLSQGIRRLKDLHELSFGGIPQDISDAAMAATGCQQIIGLAMVYASELIGTCAAYLPGDQPVVPDDALKTYAYIAGLAVKRKRAEETLQKTENTYRLLAENIHDTVWMMDMDLNVTWVSPSSAKLRGFSLDEILALPLDRQLTPESLGKAVNLWGKWMHIEQEGHTPEPGGSISIELEFICKDGHTVLLDCTLQFIRDEKGKATGILAAGRDITERRAAELAREVSEKNYRLLAENTADVVTIMDMDFNITWLSSSGEKLTGYSREEQKSLPLEKQMTQESLERALKQFAAELEREKSGTAEPDRYQDMELEIYHKDGHTLWTENRIRFIRDDQDKAVGILMQGRDITERRQVNEKLRQSEAQYRLLSEHTTDFVWLMDMNLNPTYQSPSAEKLTGFTHQELIELPLDKRVTPESLKLAAGLFFEELPKIENDPEYNPVRSLELEIYRKDGTTLWSDNKFSVIRDEDSNPVSILGEARDISERRRAEEALRESETQYRMLAEHTADTVWLMDRDFKITYVSPTVQKLRGFTPQEILEMALEKQLTPDSLKLAYELFFEELPKVDADSSYNPIYTLELEFSRKDGTTVWTESKFSIIRDGSGKAVSLLSEARDITERREAGRRIRESEILYRSLIETSPDAIGLMDINGTIMMYNKQALEVFGFELTDDLRGKNIIDMVSPEYYKESIKNAEKLQKSEIIRNWEVTSHKKDGRLFWVEISTSMIFDEEGKPKSIMAVFKDISERKLSEEKLAKSYASLKKTFNDAVNTMVKIVEMRDPYTAGHQHKVADLASAIAREMKFEDTRIEQLTMAAVIHDIGKMYVPSDILSKPGKLTDMEFRLVKTHSQCGYDIVKGMDFPYPVAEAILQHHERLDGSGYPNQLKGEDMLLEAKILAVADVIEAMFSHRPYRPALGIEKALDEISKNKGRLYDPGVVDACLAIFNSGKFEFKPV